MELTFGKVLGDAESKYQRKKKVYGESWKEMSVDDLFFRLLDEELEFVRAKETKYDEAIDIINIACMLAEKVRR